MSDLSLWFQSIPPFTRFWFGLSFATSILAKLKILSPAFLVLSYDQVVKGFQIWRPVTSVFYYPTGFHWLILLYFMYSYSSKLETGLYANRPADYLFMLLFNWSLCVIVGLLADIPVLMDPMVLSVLYVWCQVNKDTIVNFWFGTQFKAMYLPWVLFAFNLIIGGGGGIMELVGIVVGHVYFFLMYQYPQEYGGPRLIQTPQFLYQYFRTQQGGQGGTFGQAPPSRQDENQPNHRRGHNWGHGQALGGN